MSVTPNASHHTAKRLWLVLGTAAAAFLAGCAAPLPPAPPPAPQPEATVVNPEPYKPDPVVIPPDPGSLSYAKTARDYRKDAAAHLYAANTKRIYKGRMPPLLYAVGVLQVQLDPRGMVQNLNWMRAPTHAPEVIAEIERTVRAAAPYPVAVNLGHVTYTDTWLWHKSGNFQLDTLTEGQDGVIATKPRSEKDSKAAVKAAAKPTKPGKPTSVAKTNCPSSTKC
jgi:protein TonB